MKWVAGILCAVAVAVVCAVILAFAWGGLTPRIAALSLFFGLGAGLITWATTSDPAPRRLNAWDIAMLCIFALASLRAFLWLIYPVGDEWRVLSPNNLGDIAKHIQIIEYLANGAPFWPESPFFHQGSLSYYFGVDLFNSLLVLIGLPLNKGLIVVGLVGATLSAWSLWRWGGAFAIAALLFNGGLAGLLLFQTGRLADFQSELAWKNLFLAMIVPQRALLYALPATFFLLAAWREEFLRGVRLIPTWVTWVIYATMPVFSLHAFGFLSVSLAMLFCFSPPSRGDLFRYVRAAFVPSTILVFFVTGGFTHETGTKPLLGWMQSGSEWFGWMERHIGSGFPDWSGVILFWLVNFGIAVPLLVLLGAKIVRGRDSEALIFVGTGFIFFGACFCYQFAPWAWDNTKFLIFAWLACAPYLWGMMRQWPLSLRGIACILLFFSGAVSLVGGLDGRHGYTLVSRSELEQTRAALQKVPRLARIATEPTYANPVVLIGRPVVCGYDGMLWAHGVDYGQTLAALKEVLKGDDSMNESAKEIGADWIFIRGHRPIKVE